MFSLTKIENIFCLRNVFVGYLKKTKENQILNNTCLSTCLCLLCVHIRVRVPLLLRLLIRVRVCVLMIVLVLLQRLRIYTSAYT